MEPALLPAKSARILSKTGAMTAINSSGDAIFAAAAEFRHWRKEGKDVDMSWKALNKNRKTKGSADTDGTEAA